MRGVQAILLALLVLPITAPATTADEAPAAQEAFFWEADENLTGELVVRLRLTTTPSGVCFVLVAAAGQLHSEKPIWLDIQGESFRHTSYYGHIAEAHSEDLDVDTKELLTLSGHWARQTGFAGTMGKTQTIQIVATGLKDWDNRLVEGPFTLQIDCQQEFEVDLLGGSREAVVFTQQTLEGTGVTSALGPSVNAKDRIEATFTTGEVDTDIRFAGINTAYSTFDHPQGRTTHITPIDGSLHHTGKGGDYAFETTRVSGRYSNLLGILAGIDPLDSLDELDPEQSPAP